MPVTACDLLYERVLPFYEALGVEVGAILTDNVLTSLSRLTTSNTSLARRSRLESHPSVFASPLGFH
jgi:hypothetical protein